MVPDLGGHLLSVVDKATGKEMFYANPSLKFAQVAYRGAWASYGIEFNFPVSHTWVTVSPVDFATRTNPDGSASIIVGNVDLVYGMQWRVELTLQAGTLGARAADDAVQPDRRQAPLLLVDERGSPGVGRLASSSTR